MVVSVDVTQVPNCMFGCYQVGNANLYERKKKKRTTQQQQTRKKRRRRKERRMGKAGGAVKNERRQKLRVAHRRKKCERETDIS